MTETHSHLFVGRNWETSVCECGTSYKDYRSLIELQYPGWW